MARRPRRPWYGAAAALLLASVVGGVLLYGPVRVPSGDAAAMATRMGRIEGEVHALRTASAALPAAAARLEGELARIDRALAASYAAGAPDRARSALWRDREAVLDGLLQAYRQPDRMIRI